MVRITIRKLADGLKGRLRLRAVGNGRWMKEEARLIPSKEVQQVPAPAKGLGTAMHALFKPLGDVVLEIPPREPMREPPRFD